ncbi:MAG: hypothetical protein JOS17DRAFT_269897 [Linnemannia elongata]|nr:MAG: hypothetical protein JOS17DRAFT_269897 [Linnemannia elongata]
MDYLSQLPHECLRAILALFALEDHFGTLSAIARTNKRLASAALPYLYDDPYRVFSAERRFKQGEDYYGDRIPDKYLTNGHRLTRMLLRRLSIISTTEVHKSTTLAYGIPYSAIALNTNPTTAITGTNNTPFFSPQPLSPIFDYHSHIRHLHVTPLAIFLGSRFRRSRRAKAFIREDGEFRRMCTSVLYGTKSLPPPVEDNGISPSRSQDASLMNLFQVMFHRETSWTLAEPILEQLRSLTISVSDVERYHQIGVIGRRLRSLEKVRFMMDDEVSHFNGFRQPASLSNRVVIARREKKMQAVVHFVKEFILVFGAHQLRQVEFVDGVECGAGLWPECSVYTFPTEIQLEVHQLLAPLFRYQPPSFLNQKNWIYLAAHPDVSDLSKVKEVRCLRVGDEEEWSHWRLFMEANRGLLQKCRSLEQIQMYSIATNSFCWAVQEKKDFDRRLQSAELKDSREPHQESEKGLVPLAGAIIFGSQEQMIPDVNHIAFAFSQTLTRLQAYEYHSPSNAPFATTLGTTVGGSLFGQGWVNLLFLTDLCLDSYLESRDRLRLTPDLLSHCPNVASVHLGDNVREYRCEDIMPFLPATLDRLETLYLRGWSALSFDPATLSSTRSLRKVMILMKADTPLMCHFIPPSEELNWSFGGLTNQQYQSGGVGEEGGGVGGGEDVAARIIRPQWSWDWDLPELTRLVLTAEFAYRFEFRMLQVCPSLKRLELDIKSYNAVHRRTITEADFYSSEMERVVAPSVCHIDMFGQWCFENRTVLEQFLAETFPNLEFLYADGWEDMATGQIIDAVRAVHGGGDNEEEEEMLDVMYPEWSSKRRDLKIKFGWQRSGPSRDELRAWRICSVKDLVANGANYVPGIEFAFDCYRERYVLLK